MSKKLLLLALLLMGALNTEARKPTDYKRWFLNPGIGFYTTLNDFRQNAPTDNLAGFPSGTNLSLSFLDLGFCFKKNWGIELNIQVNNISPSLDKARAFNKHIDDTYGSQYYISRQYAWNNYPDTSTFSFEDYNSGFGFGAFYKNEKNRIIYKGKLILGTISYSIGSSNYTLKEKGTNRETSLEYNTKSAVDFFTVTSSFSFGYRVSDRFILLLDGSYRYTLTNIKYTIQQEDRYTHSITEKSYHYPGIHSLGLSLSMMYEIQRFGIFRRHRHHKMERN